MNNEFEVGDLVRLTSQSDSMGFVYELPTELHSSRIYVHWFPDSLTNYHFTAVEQNHSLTLLAKGNWK